MSSPKTAEIQINGVPKAKKRTSRTRLMTTEMSKPLNLAISTAIEEYPNNLLSPISPFIVMGRKNSPPHNLPSIPGTPNFPSQKSQQRQQIIEELNYFKNEVQHYEEIMKQIPLIDDVKDEGFEMTVIVQLMKWILEYGNPAVQDLDHFKDSVKIEFESMMNQIDENNKKTQKLSMIITEKETENQNLIKQIKEKDAFLKEKEQVFQKHQENFQDFNLKNRDVHDLIKHIEDLENAKNHIEKKNRMLENDITVLRHENEEISEERYDLQDQISKLKRELNQLKYQLQSMDQRHHQEIEQLLIKYEGEKAELESKQEKLLTEVQQPKAPGLRDRRATISIPTDYDLNEQDMSLLEYQDGLGDGEVLTLEAEIDEYEDSDDAWLSESEEEIDDPISPDPFSPPQEIDKEAEFQLEKQNLESERQVHDKFTSEKYQLEKIGENSVSNFSIEKYRLEKEELKSNDSSFAMERSSLGEHHLKQNLGLSFSVTQLSLSPKRDEYHDQFMKIEQEPTQKANIENFPRPSNKPRNSAKITAIKIPAEKGKDEIIRQGLGFKNLLAHFMDLEKEKPGAPVVKDMKEYKLINKWTVDQERLSETKAKEPHKSGEIDASEALQIAQSIIKVTRTKHHTLKPRWQGYLKIVRTKALPPHIVANEPLYYFCLDGLPINTNVDVEEPDCYKNRKNDMLVPCLFFFENEAAYKDLIKLTAGISVRDIKFQKIFSKYCKGILQLHTRVVDSDEARCVAMISEQQGKPIRLPPDVGDKVPDKSELNVYVVGERESHKFQAKTKEKRDEWVQEIQKLIRKRSTMAEIRRKSIVSGKKPMSGYYKMPVVLDESME